jgi:arabinogalactan oligomer/maltooligosaccharide transport system permease protein
VTKIVLLAIMNAIALWAAVILAGDRKWISVAVVAAATIAIDLIYASPRRAIPLKFLVPGTVFLVAFQIFPIFYNVNIAFTNWSTGHNLGKDEAITAIQLASLVEGDKSYVMAPARNQSGDLVLILVDEQSGRPFVGTREGLEPLPKGDVVVGGAGTISSAKGYEVVTGAGLLALSQALQSYTVPTEGGAIRAEGLDFALELQPTLRYVPRNDTFVSLENGTVYRDNGSGSYESAAGQELEPGWRTHIGLANFRSIVNDPLIRDPFVRVFVWTFTFAFLTVLISFSIGLFLAITLDKPGMRFLRSYRAVLVIPYAVPGFLSILVWAGLLNDDFGTVNRALNLDIPWLFDPFWAKVSVLLVSVWLTVPYFFLVSLGALQSIPNELVEAARVDGGGAWQVFKRVVLPLLLVAVAPLLIASFAFNFNNFNNIYLLTGGGPPSNDQSVAGSTDILISYTWKLAFERGQGQNYGLAAAISIVIFFIVGTISAISFWRTKGLENLR